MQHGQDEQVPVLAKQVVVSCRGQEIIRANPIEEVEYEKKSPPKLKHISRNELKRLMATPFEDSNMELARRMFIFFEFLRSGVCRYTQALSAPYRRGSGRQEVYPQEERQD